MFPQARPNLIATIYKPPNKPRFLEQIITEFQELDLKYEHYFFGDFNMNLLFRGTYILNKSNKTKKFCKKFRSILETILNFVRPIAVNS